MTNPFVSIVVNNYNYGRFLPEAIDSALAQTYPHTEVVVVDDGSTDNSRQIIAGYSERVTAVLKENGGQASACNAGFAACHGNIVLFLDSDDLLLPTAVERVVPLFDREGVVKVHWPLWIIDSDGRRSNQLCPSRELAHGDLRDEVIRNGPTNSVNAPTSGNAWARSFLDAVMPVQEYGDRHGADAYLFTLAPVYGRICRISEPLGYYRVHAEAFSRRIALADLQRDLSRYDQHCQVLCEYLRKANIQVDPEQWQGPHSPRAWMRDMLAASQDLTRLVPVGATFALVDDGAIGDTFVTGRRAVPFPEKDGQYWGPPPDDAAAVAELERQRGAGAEFLVFVWSTFWWLDYYHGFHQHLRRHYRCVLKNERVLVFALQVDAPACPTRVGPATVSAP
jgi:cellulose synthase/poly-beta-1,6-N-acetylglucosamine synthase-like glycosyltransferase